MNNQRGFTVIEVVVAVMVLTTLSIFFIIQNGDLKRTAHDQNRKVAVNTMAYSLINSFYKDHGYYPQSISRDNLKVVDPKLFTDPNGNTLDGDRCLGPNGKEQSKNHAGKVSNYHCDYHYSAIDCNADGQCQKFILTAKMETESDYEKSSSK